MELFKTEDFYIFVNGEYSLWWDRQTGAFIPKACWELTSAEDPICLGTCEGIIGKIQHPTVFDSRLILIKECVPVGKIHSDHIVYKIKSIAFLQLGTENADLSLPQCQKHKSSGSKKPVFSNTSIFDIQKNSAFTKTWGTLKSAGNTIKSTTQQAAAIATGTPKKRDIKDKEKFERRIIEEFHKIFADTDSFYFCRTSDLTNSLQRLCNLQKNQKQEDALWKTVDDRFFWNKYMLKELLEPNNPLFDPWILPIIQGYVQIEDCKVELGNDFHGVKTSPKYEIFNLSIISRRSRFRAGTRYKRRGVDENGECANYVETEQIVAYQHHEVSFVQVRGSVPVYWSQPGYKYRPPPRLDKDEAETKIAFEKHFTNEIKKYGPICVINLVEQNGKEKIIWDAYSNHMFLFNSPHLTYCTFDFHEYCRGMHFENVSILINTLADIIREANYCWRDRQGHICSQIGVFRVNCIDCLDRTNVVQTALGKAVMEIQFTKLGLISPEGSMPSSIKRTFQQLWANNGDIISKQYAGTNALKGDYTRTGERKFTGIMKDGMNSANRYYKQHFKDSIRQCSYDLMLGHPINETDVDDLWSYLCIVGNIASELVPGPPPTHVPSIALTQEYELVNALYYMSRYYLSRFKDSTRQGTIDLMLGNYVSEDFFSENKMQDEEDSAATAEHVKLLIEDCKKMLINNPEIVLGGWGLINADPSTGDPSETEMDAILILTKDSYFVADYDDQVDRITKYQRVNLDDLTLLECGMPEAGASLFKSSTVHYCIRLNYAVNKVHGYYHMFRSTNLRFFNNLAVVIKNNEEEIESLKAICEAFQVAMDIGGIKPIPYYQGQRLDKRKSKIVSMGNTSSNIYLDAGGLPNITRNVSESQLLALKNVGSKALSNMSQQFSKLNKLSTSLNRKKGQQTQPKFTVGKAGRNESSSESEEEYENSIFQPDVSIELGSLPYATDTSTNSTEKSDSFVEQGVEVTESSSLFDATLPEGGKSDAFLPSVGIVMGSTGETGDHTQILLENRQLLAHYEDSSTVGNVCLSSIMKGAPITNIDTENMTNVPPEITLNTEKSNFDSKIPKPSTLKLDRKLSHSSGEVNIILESPSQTISHPVVGECRFEKRSNSDQDITLNIAQSQSESALKNRLVNLTSPVAAVTKDYVLSPFSKLAKGVQNFGSNLDPRKLAGSGVRQVTENELEEHRKLEEKWSDCKTRLIALYPTYGVTTCISNSRPALQDRSLQITP